MKNFIKPFSLFFTVILLFTGCRQKQNYVAEINEWHQQREARLKKPTGWLSLAGLFWLEEGENSFGADKSNNLVFPEKAPAFCGSFFLREGKVKVVLNPDAGITIDGKVQREVTLRSDVDGNPNLLQFGSLSWYVIKRGDRFLIRLKDAENPAIAEFKGIERFPVDKKWRIKARLEPYDPPKKLQIGNVLGQVSESDCPGALVFDIDGKEYRLDPEGKPGDKSYFLIFTDETSGRETYGAGRFLSIEAPGADGITYIDFNKAYNPPCVFSPFATCPLPPKQNHVPLAITAGEKTYGHH